tara:strand:+ start:264 stop:680 length:417 start_codon:yes stop_codon:yes gene_type:complete
MRQIFIAILSCFLFACTAVSEDAKKVVNSQPPLIQKQVEVGAFITISCASVKAMSDIMEGDKVSVADAGKIFLMYEGQQLCMRHYPRVFVILDKLVKEYLDYENDPSQLWKLREMEIWTLVSKRFLLYRQIKSRGYEI